MFKKETKKGFTLIEMMVSVTIFAIVMVVSLGAILTILDSNRKSRTLTEVMSNLNFSLESMTRSIKTGVDPGGDSTVLYTYAIRPESSGFVFEKIEYKRLEDEDTGRGYIARRVGVDENSSSPWVPITSELIDIQNFNFLISGIVANNQPRIQIYLKGEVQTSPKIKSAFAIQTTISQRKLNLIGSEKSGSN
jgi:prepilin-type N-terminal cleavage/methylation domain-containing protein